MKTAFTYIAILFSFTVYSQCNCDSIPELKAEISCDTTRLKNEAFLYYVFNCDSASLIFEKNNIKKSLFTVEKDLIEYTYRLGYLLIKEFPKSLLFRFDCPATGSCSYALVDKNSGVLIKTYNQVIYPKSNEDLDILIYFIDSSLNEINVSFMNSSKNMTFKVGSSCFMNSVFPTSQFKKPIIKDNVFILPYTCESESKESKNHELKISLK
jgi:hypothetical protein